MIKKAYILILFLLINTGLFSQAFSFSGGFSGYKMRYHTFGYFAESFNRYHMGQLKKEMNNFNFAVGEHVGMAFFGEKFGMEFNYFNYFSSASATFNNGDSRNFRAHLGYGQFAFNFGIAKDNKCVFLLFGMGGGRLKIDSWYEYDDGTCNYGYDMMLNGSYRGAYSPLFLGIRGSVPLMENVSLGIRFERILTGHTYGSHFLTDKDDEKYQANSQTVAIPSDYYHYHEIIEKRTNLPLQYWVQPAIRGFSLTVTIKYDIWVD